MPRNITAAQKRAQDFSESDVLTQTNQIRYDSFFLHGTENRNICLKTYLYKKSWSS